MSPRPYVHLPISRCLYVARLNVARLKVTNPKILLTTIVSAERSFSTLKLIKTFNCSTMLNSRISFLAMIAIENEVARKLDYDKLLEIFTEKKARRVPFT